VTIPIEQQCALPGCDREAVDPSHSGGLCRSHLDGEADPEPVTESEESPVATSPDPSGQELDTSLTVDRGVYPQGLVDVEQWLTWKETDDGRKVPRAPYEHPSWPEKFVSAQDPAVWRDFETVQEWAEKAPGFGTAFNIRDREDYPDEDLVLIDYDDARDPETGAVHPTVREHIDRAGSYADVSTSGTGVHILARGALPDGVKAIEAHLPDAEGFADAEIEVYDSARFVAMTGQHIAVSAARVTRCQHFINELAEEFATVAEGTPDEMLREPEKTAAEIADVETTNEFQDLLDAIQHTGPGDIRLRSTVTQERGDGSKSLDPSWASSESGTRLAQVGDGWVYRKGMVGLDALQVVALEERIIHDEREYPSGEEFWQAVEALRERGAHIPEYEAEDGALTEALPVALLDTLEPDELRRYARKRGIDWPTTDEVRDRLQEAVHDALREEGTAVIDAPTGAGKSHLTSTTAWRDVDEAVTGDEPVIHLSETCAARDENLARSEDTDDVDAGILYGRKEACPVAAGDHDPRNAEDDDDRAALLIPDPILGDTPPSQWFDEMCDRRGLSFSDAHARAEELLGELPCCQGELLCHGTSQWANKPRDSDGNPSRDVIHATHEFAYVPGLVAAANVVFDEQPDFTTDLGTERVRRAVTAFLEAIDSPVATWEAFVQLARHDGWGGDAAAERDAVDDALDRDPRREWYFTDRDAHALAPALARAIWKALGDDVDAIGRHAGKVMHEPPRLDAGAREDDGWNAHWVTVVIDESNEIQTVRDAPHLGGARSVVGLDAHPAHPLWQRNVDPDITVADVLDPDERALWRRLERNLFVVQVGDATRPYSGSRAREWFDAGNRVREAEYRHLQEEFGTRAAIAPKAVEDPDDVDASPLATVMREAGIDDPRTMHQGEEKSRNDFADERTLVVDGCVDPGDGYVLDLLAEFGYDAEPELVECSECDGDGCPADPDCRDGHRRAHGREFVGDDADVAAAILESVRSNHTAQSAGRIARRPDRDDDWGIAFLRTNAAPPGLVDLQVPGAEWVATDLQEAIVDELRERPAAPTREIADAVDCSKEHVRETLGRLEDAGVVDRHRGAGDHGADLYGLLVDEADSVVNLADQGETANTHVQDYYSTWSLAISRPDPVSRGVDRRSQETATDTTGSQVGLATFSGGDPPPDDPE
jgi:hypothetical protein